MADLPLYNPGQPEEGGAETPHQLPDGGGPTLANGGLTKQCWSCNETTPYDEGWCRGCQDTLPVESWPIVSLSVVGGPLPPLLSGMIRIALSDWIKSVHREANRPTYSPRGQAKAKPVAGGLSGEEVLKLIGLG